MGHPGIIARATPDRAAVIFADGQLSYAALDQDSRAIAAMLHQAGLKQGDVIAMLIGNCPAFFSVAWAAQRSGLYFLPLSTRLTSAEARYILEDSGAAALFSDHRHRALAQAAAEGLPVRLYDCHAPAGVPGPQPPEIEGGDMLYTSGTTGRPKGVRRPITGLPLGADARRVERARALFGLGEDSVFLTPAPLYHAAPLRFAMNLLRTGGTVVGMARFDAAETLATMARHKVTHSQWVPTMFNRLLALPDEVRTAHDLASHQAAIHAGAPCPAEVKRRMIAWWGPILHEYYSGTESIGFTHCTSHDWLARPGTVGKPWGCQIHVIGEHGKPVAAGETGTIFFSGAAPLCYHNDPAKTAAATAADGMATMGDIGHVDADGYLFLTDRRAFTIISGGVNIYPSEIEAVLTGLPGVADAAVFGIPDADLGEAVFAVVELLPGQPADAVQAHGLREAARASLAGFKLPRFIRFASVGRTETGKLEKARLREALGDPGLAFAVTGVNPAPTPDHQTAH